MARFLVSLAFATLAVGLYILWGYEHEHTRIRAPWTGVTLVASAFSLVAVGVVGRGWRALLLAGLAAGTGFLLNVLVIIWGDEPSAPTTADEPETEWAPLAFVIGLPVAQGVALAALGILLRRAVGALQRGRASPPEH